MPVMPLHNPDHAARVVVPKAPLGNVTNGSAQTAPGLGAKALLAKKMARNGYVSRAIAELARGLHATTETPNTSLLPTTLSLLAPKRSVRPRKSIGPSAHYPPDRF
jgi:hypothetical protein